MLSKNQIKEIQSLHIKKFREAKKLFIAEGVKTVLEILEHAPILLQELYAIREFIEANKATLRRLNIKFTEVDEAELKKISLQSTPNNVLAICSYFNEPKGVLISKNSFHFILTMCVIREIWELLFVWLIGSAFQRFFVHPEVVIFIILK